MMKKIISILVAFSLGISCCFIAKADGFEVSAKAAIVVNAETGGVIFSQNADEKLPMASTTKIMTAILLCENCELKNTVVATKEMVTVEGSSMGLLEGDVVSFEALLYGMMLPSGNDAATTAAIAMAGSLESFALMMNKKAAEIGMDSTNFVTPSGLDADEHYSTARDMAKLAVYAMQNPIFRKAVSSETKTLQYGNPPYRRTLKGHNKILSLYEGGNGIKTGYTSKSGKCLVSSAERNGKRVIAVTLNDSSTLENHSKLLDLGFERLVLKELTVPERLELKIIAETELSAELQKIEEAMYLTSEEAENLSYKIKFKNMIYAPVKKGETLGEMEYFLDGRKIKSIELKAANGICPKRKEHSFCEKMLEVIFKMISVS